jgi:hypothetical protein
MQKMWKNSQSEEFPKIHLRSRLVLLDISED